jgi:succinate dehydrogenase / fumarate reductase cytochrome b subunit
MSAVATNSTLARGAFFYRTTVGKKAVMAVTGVVLFGFLIGHMAGNLQFFLGREVMNAYAEKLHALGPLLWAVRLALLTAVALHIHAAFQLWRLQRTARPVGYAKFTPQGSTYAARTMYWSGPIVGFFIVYHLLHLTTGTVHPAYEYLNAYDNLVIGFKQPVVSLFYVVAMILLGMHMYHGIWSMFQSLGFAHPRYTPKIKAFAKLFTFVIVLGFIAVPIAILGGFHPDFDRV